MPDTNSPTTENPRSRPSKNAIPPDGIRCAHTDAAGRQCRNLALRPTGKDAARGKSGLCLAHSTEERQPRDAEAVAKELMGSTPQLDTALAVNHVLGRLFELTASNRIPIRNAALLAYIASLLLFGMGGVKSEMMGVGGSEALKLMARHALEIIESESGSDSNPDSESVSS
ncbi:MAG: hypothetical protein WAM91_04155 [Candidatus Acidiferrales bacterium]